LGVGDNKSGISATIVVIFSMAIMANNPSLHKLLDLTGLRDQVKDLCKKEVVLGGIRRSKKLSNWKD
jgi:hypothetical protein